MKQFLPRTLIIYTYHMNINDGVHGYHECFFDSNTTCSPATSRDVADVPTHIASVEKQAPFF